jgi:hypothetical protein
MSNVFSINNVVDLIPPDAEVLSQFDDFIGLDHVDILITDNDLTLDGVKEVVLIDGRRSIAQDLKHMIRETGYVVQMVGERSSDMRAHYMKLIEIEMEEDSRLVPGTAKVTETKLGELFATAITTEYGQTALRAYYG